MATGSWLKTHRKQVITHLSIIAAFVLFTIFAAEPLFDRLEQVAGESQLYETSIPAETNNITYWFNQFQGVTTEMLEIEGWAFIEGYDSVNSEIYIVLKSTDRTYVFTTEIVIKTDVTQAFNETGLNLDYSGFTALIPLRKIANAEYTVGIYIAKGDVEALQYTAMTIEK